MKRLSISLALVLIILTLSNCTKVSEVFSKFGKTNEIEQVTQVINCVELRDRLKNQKEPTKYIIEDQCTKSLNEPLIINKPHTTILGNNATIKASRQSNTPNGFIINAKGFVLGNIALEGFTAPITVSETGAALIFNVSLKESFHSAVLVGTSKIQYETQLINNEPLRIPSFFTGPNLDGFFISNAYGNTQSCNCANAIEDVTNGVSVDESTTASLTICSTDDRVNSIDSVTGDPGIGIHAKRLEVQDTEVQGASTIQICGPTDVIGTQKGLQIDGSSSIELNTGTLDIRQYQDFAIVVNKGTLRVNTSNAGITVDDLSRVLCTDKIFNLSGGVPTIPTISDVVPNAITSNCPP